MEEVAGAGFIQKSIQDLASWQCFLCIYCARGGKSWLCRTHRAHRVEEDTFEANRYIYIYIYIYIWFPIHTASAPSTTGTSTGGGAVIRKPRRAWLESTPAMDHGINGKRIHM